MIRQLFGKFLAWLPWFKPLPEPSTAMVEPLIDLTPPPEPPRPKRRRGKNIQKPAHELHITDVLNLLPKCRDLMAPLRRIDERAFRFWRVFGAKLVPAAYEPWKVPGKPQDLPATGMIFLYQPGWEKEDLFPGCFIYFTKLEKNPYDAVIPLGTVAMFNVTVAFTEYDRKTGGFGYEYFAAIDASGAVSIVSQRNMVRQSLPRGGSFWQTSWGYSPMLEYHFKEQGRLAKKGETLHKSVSAFGESMFRDAMRSHCAGFDDFQIRAERDGTSVAFNVALGRTPQFFKDRETDLATDGRRKRIFHAVAQHERVLASGKTSIVPAHYRGERKFLWNGERITITPSERSFAKTFKFAATRLNEGEVFPEGVIDLAEFAPRLRQATESEWRKLH